MGARVSIGMPVWNGATYVRSALESVLAQTYGDFELTIADNASTDGTADICRDLARQDTRIRYFRHDSNLGAARNHNFVFERSSGEYFKWAAYDDLCAPALLERCVAVLDTSSEAVLAFPQTRVVDETGATVVDYDAALPCEGGSPSERIAQLLLVPSDRSLLHWCYPVYGLMRAAVLGQTPLIGSFNSSDDVLLVELALRGALAEVPERLFSSRRHAARSLEANVTQEAVAAWFDPAQGELYPAMRTRVFLGYLSAVRHVPMPWPERVACHSVLARSLARERRWRVIAGELKIKARETATRARGARPVRA